MMKKRMASSLTNKLLIIILFISLSSLSSLSSSSLPSTPTISPFQELSPEIAPLLPSPGDALPSGAGPGTIPSSPSPPDPDTSDASSYPDPAFAPFASPPVSSHAPPSHPPSRVLLLFLVVSSASLRLRGVIALL
ncbi:Classical arabinogalactan protein 25 [Hirschfeldia incana]|nr:Classical arabinogalactan protein 25 [Hirschfeldia incana]